MTRNLLIGLAAILLLATACGDGFRDNGRLGAGDDDDSVDWGNDYNTLNEKPGFGDPEILAMTADTPYDDPFADQTLPLSTGDIIYIRVLWGNLTLDSDNPAVVDYSGTISIDDGLLVIERTVAFDQWDTEIDTREDPTSVAWHSVTRPHYDGLVLRLEPGVTAGARNFLHLRIGPYSKDIAVDDLLDRVTIEPTGSDDDQIAFASQLTTGPGSGFVSGHWRDLPVKDGGVVKGKWEDGPGDLFGHLRCRYIPTDESSGEIRGKMIDRKGNFEGLLEGSYERTRDDIQAGIFLMDWYDADHSKTGVMKGIFFKRNDAGRGFWLGNWWTE